MIPVLLWRCPICRTDDALRQKIGWWKPDRLWCVNCPAAWEVRRVIGGDYQLRVIGGPARLLGQEESLSQWYDWMKAGLKLTPIADPSVDLGGGEVLWAKSKRVKLFREAAVPRKNAAWHFSYENFGSGQLFLTNERLIWRSARKVDAFWLGRLRGVAAIVHRRLDLQYDDGQRYKLRFAEESCLKWLNYIALAVQGIAGSGQRVELSNY